MQSTRCPRLSVNRSPIIGQKGWLVARQVYDVYERYILCLYKMYTDQIDKQTIDTHVKLYGYNLL